MKNPIVEHRIECLFSGEVEYIGKLKQTDDGTAALKFIVGCYGPEGVLRLECRVFGEFAVDLKDELRINRMVQMTGPRLAASGYETAPGVWRPCQNYQPTSVEIF